MAGKDPLVSIPTILNCLLILSGIVMMLVSIVQVWAVSDALPYVAKQQRPGLARRLTIHRGLMVFFLFGYLFVLASIVLKLQLISETLVSLIFLLGSVFVLVGVNLQKRLFCEVQRTLRGIVPICAQCKQIRPIEGDPWDQAAWKPIESYITERTNAAFSHSLCPACYEKERAQLPPKKTSVEEVACSQ